MKEAYCSGKVSELLKKKGFDEPCMAFWEYELSEYSLHISSEFPINNSELEKEKEFKGFSAPTHQMAMRWLREVHDIKIMIRPYVDGTYSYEILNGFWYVNFDSYEDAVEAAIKYSLENLI